MSTGRLAALEGARTASSVAPVSSGYERALRPCLALLHRTQPARESSSGSLSGPLHRCVEGDGRGREVGAADKCERVLRAPLAVHARVLPIDRERPVVADPVERAEERLEVDVAVAGR